MMFSLKDISKMKATHFVGVIALGYLLVIVCTIIWGLNKGFDLTDEGFYMMNLVHPEESPPVWQYQFLFNQLFGWMDLGVIGYRVMRLVLTLVSSYVFCIGFWKWMSSNRWFQSSSFQMSFISLFSFVTLGSFLSYSLFPTVLSYNSLTLIMLQFTSGLLFFFIAVSASAQKRKTNLLLLAIGLCIALQFFAKFTSGAALFCYMIFILMLVRINQNAHIRRLLIDVMFLSGGVFAGIAWYSITAGSFFVWIIDMQEALVAMKSHAFDKIIWLYYETTKLAISKGVIDLIEIPLLLFILLKFYPRKVQGSTLSQHKFHLLFLVIISYIAYQVNDASWFKSGMNYMYEALNAYLLLLASITAMSVALMSKSSASALFSTIQKRELIIVCLFLFVIPLTAATGTSNSLPVQTVQYVFTWFALGVLILHFISAKLKGTFISSAMLLLICTIAFSQTINGFVYNPYRLNGKLTEQTEKIELLKNASGIRFHPTIKKFITDIYSQLLDKTSFKQGDPLIAMNGSAGLVYLLGGKSPGSSWYKFETSPQNCYNLNKTQISNLERLVIFVDGTGQLPNEFVSCLKEKGVNFPEGYTKLGQVPHYRYQAEVSILVPRSMLK